LIGFRFAFVVLNIHSWISWPWRLVNRVTTAALPGLSKKGIAHALQISKAHIGRLCPHLLKDFVNACHDSKISIVILNVNSPAAANSPQSAALLDGLRNRWVARMVGPKSRMRGFFALAKPRNPLRCWTGYGIGG
jgi:hypothetical protein